MSAKTTMKWTGGLAFDTEVNGHHLIMDVDPQSGGKDLGPRPKPLLLAALSGCSGMDVVSILEKMRIQNYQFQVDVEADSTTDHPIHYHTIRVFFRFTGDNLPPDKVVKAVELSLERYCGVHAMLKKAANITHKVFINEEEVQQ
ncbi:MAG: OsmC family protein [Candidatus Syntrophosphaera sp.]|nr:OsmC family protein [Candidatus Syntrophosphaera sp.]